MNYIKHDGHYYIFDATAYKDYLIAAIETGSLFHYNASDQGTNIHKISEEHLTDFVEYYRGKGREEIVFFGFIDIGEDLFPIDSRSRDDQHITVVPHGYQYYITEIYNDDTDGVEIKEGDPPERTPDIEKYHPSECYDGEQFRRDRCD